MDSKPLDRIFEELRSRMMARLEEELSPRLQYHNRKHTEYVLSAAERIAENEGVSDPVKLFVLKTAALFHDTGFLYTYQGHEEMSCRIMAEELEKYNLPNDIVSEIRQLILDTKVPTSPNNELGRILCDADLDYLGKENYEEISNRLKEEFLEFGILKDGSKWDQLQISFLEGHHYFTEYSSNNRGPGKARTLKALKEKDSAGA